jgi:murein DD-endopeptidase MepM/ murein hydrolase activator NlpD
VLRSVFQPFVLALLTFTAPVPPVNGTVVDGFRAPACQRCVGHRGVTIATAAQSPVRAATSGIIVYVGQVARILYVVEDIGQGAKITYGRLQGASVAFGQVVAAGDVLGVSGPELYLGVRVGGRYVDPLRFLGFARGHLVGPGSVIVG